MPKPNHRDKLIQSGLAVFHEHGFHASGVQNIVDHAGIPKGSFYNHFKSKDELGLEILDYYWELYADARAGLSDSGIPVLERIERHLGSFGQSEFGCLIGNFSGEMANSEIFRSHLSSFYKKWTSDLATCLKEGQEDGTVRDDDTATNMAEFVISGLEGAILKAKVDRDPGAIKRLCKSILKFLKRQ